MSVYRRILEAKTEAERQAIADEYIWTADDLVKNPRDYAVDEYGILWHVKSGNAVTDIEPQKKHS